MHQLYREQTLPIALEEAWSFFSNPANLAVITPPWLKFRILSPLPKTMYAGLVIEYRITLAPGPPVTWVTEISHVDEPQLFVDEQRFGPYKFWHHQHKFRAVSGGVQMEDVVHYKLPFEPLGDWCMGWWIRRKVAAIFDYRYSYLDRRFNSSETKP